MGTVTKKTDVRLQKALVVLLAVVSVMWGLSVWPQRTGNLVVLDQASVTDAYAAGSDIRVEAPVNGDGVFAGRVITVNAEVRADFVAAGDTIAINARIHDDVRAAARSVAISAPVDGHVVAAGYKLEVSENATVGDWVWLAGQIITVRGDVGGDLRIAGDTVVLDGLVSGDVDVFANSLSLSENAEVNGDVIWRGVTAPRISDQARVDGQLIREPAPFDARESQAWLDRLLLVLSIALVTLLLGFVAPGFIHRSERIARHRPLIVLGAALVFIVVLPVLAILAMATGVGWLLSVLLLLLLFLALLSSSALGLGVVTRLGAETFSMPSTTYAQQVMAVLMTALVVWLLGWIPGVFAPVIILLSLLGLGTLCLQAYSARRAAVSEARGEPFARGLY